GGADRGDHGRRRGACRGALVLPRRDPRDGGSRRLGHRRSVAAVPAGADRDRPSHLPAVGERPRRRLRPAGFRPGRPTAPRGGRRRPRGGATGPGGSRTTKVQWHPHDALWDSRPRRDSTLPRRGIIAMSRNPALALLVLLALAGPALAQEIRPTLDKIKETGV